MKDRLLHIILLFTLCLVASACSDSIEEVMPDSSISVSLGITTRAVEQEGKEVGDGLPQSLKVWIYGVKDNEEGETLLAYISQDASEGSPIFNDGTDIYGNPVEVVERELEKGKEYGKLNFYVVLNDGTVTWAQQETSLDENITSEALKAMTFSPPSGEKAGADNEQLMYGEMSQDIVSSKTNYEVKIPVERSVAKLELYFSKNDAGKDLTVNSVSLKSDVIKGYLCPQTTLADIYGSTSSSVDLLTTPVDVDCTSIEEYGNFSDDEKNFQQTVSSFLLENSVGLDWKVEGERYPSGNVQELQKAYKVTIGYTYDGEVKTESFYLPPVERNVLYKIYVRIRELDWEVDLFPYTGVSLEPEFGL